MTVLQLFQSLHGRKKKISEQRRDSLAGTNIKGKNLTHDSCYHKLTIDNLNLTVLNFPERFQVSPESMVAGAGCAYCSRVSLLGIDVTLIKATATI